MPELPEVQTIANQLSFYLPLKVLNIVKSIHADTFIKQNDFNPSSGEIINIYRLGKSLVLEMKEGVIVSGLGMSGGWRISDKDITQKHTHFKFVVKNEKDEKLFLAYIDPRRFGRLYLFNHHNFNLYKKGLAPDPTSRDFNEVYLKSTFDKYPQRQIKVFLLDQKFFPGIGNYMASEICALAAIRPTRRTGRITKKEREAIILATKRVIEGSVKNNGLTFSGGYFDANGEKGEGVNNLVVFHQKQCGLCKKDDIKKIVLAGRGTYYCPHCQR
jgi:formamidopyrimidine-DNA glycosylase